jgi:uncharacterized membrane protein
VQAQTRIHKVVLAGVLSALTILLGLFPSVGFIPVPTPAGAATTLHIPAILGGVLGGPFVGGLVGLTFGIFSFLRATLPLFKDPLVAIVPRVLIGIVAWAAYTAAARASKSVLFLLAIAAMLVAAGFAAQILQYSVILGAFILVLAVAAGGALLWFVSRGDKRAVAVAVAAILGSFTNTSLVLGLATLLGYLPLQGVILVAATHGIPEAIVAAVIVTAIAVAVGVADAPQRSRL